MLLSLFFVIVYAASGLFAFRTRNTVLSPLAYSMQYFYIPRNALHITTPPFFYDNISLYTDLFRRPVYVDNSLGRLDIVMEPASGSISLRMSP